MDSLNAQIKTKAELDTLIANPNKEKLIVIVQQPEKSSTWQITLPVGISLCAFILSILTLLVLNPRSEKKKNLKTHFIGEVKDIRKSYNDYINKIICGNVLPREIDEVFRALNANLSNLMILLNEKFKVDKDYLTEYHLRIQTMIANDLNYTSAYKENRPFTLEVSSLRDIQTFILQNNDKFNRIVIQINGK